MAELLRHRGDALIATGLGSATWDCFAAGDSPEYLYSWGGMGLAVPTALGLALAQPGRRVVAITGDGEMLMGLGSLAVVGDQAPKNLAMLVLDNEKFGETGRQRGLTAGRTDIAAAAKACRLPRDHDGDRAGRGGRAWRVSCSPSRAPCSASPRSPSPRTPGRCPKKTAPPSPTASAPRWGWRRPDRRQRLRSACSVAAESRFFRSQQISQRSGLNPVRCRFPIELAS